MKTIIFPKEDNGYAYRMRTPLIKDDQNDDADYLQLAKKANIQVLEHYMAKDDCTIKVYNDDDTCDTYNAKAGDLIFFQGTYNTGDGRAVTHVGIYCGNGVMLHCGDPIGYASVNTPYWQNHFYSYGRLN